MVYTKKQSIFIIVLLLSSMIIFTDDVLADSQCLNSTHFDENSTIFIDGDPLNIAETKECPHGCSTTTQKCKPNEMNASMLGFSILILTLGLFMFLVPRLDDDGEVHPIATAKASIVPIILVTLGFVDIFPTWMRTLYGIMALGTIIIIMLNLRLIKKSPNNIQDDNIDLRYE